MDQSVTGEDCSCHTGASVLLWLREGVSPESARSQWAGAHGHGAAQSAQVRDYRQYHFAPTATGLWPTTAYLDTEIPHVHRVDAAAEITYDSAWSPLLDYRHSAAVRRAEHDLFARSLLYVTRPGGALLFPGSPAVVGARAVVLLRRRGRLQRGSHNLLYQQLCPALQQEPGIIGVRVQLLMPFARSFGNAAQMMKQGYADHRYHHTMVIEAVDESALAAALTKIGYQFAAEMARNFSALHAYQVERTYIYRLAGRPTLPQTSTAPARKPPLEPVLRRDIPRPPRSRVLPTVTKATPARSVPVPGFGAEDVVLDKSGRALVGLDDGSIVAVDLDTGRSTVLARTGGRPLGLELHPDETLIVCDAHRGLLRVDIDTGAITTLVDVVEDVPLRFCSNATTTPDGTIWFTQSSTRYDLEHYFGALLEHRPSGRLLRRAPDGTIAVVLDNLYFANGIAMTGDASAVIYAETAAARLSRYDIDTGAVSTVLDNLPGYPDNVSVAPDGLLWVALTNPRSLLLEKLATSPPLLRRALWRIPQTIMPAGTATTWVMAVTEDGEVRVDLQQSRTDFHMVTGVAASTDTLVLASLRHGHLLVLPKPG